MSDENEDTGKQEAVRQILPSNGSSANVGESAQESSPALEQITPSPERNPEFGESVLYVDGAERILQATVQAALADGTANLRVTDPDNQYGRFDVSRAGYSAEKLPGTFHFPAQE